MSYDNSESEYHLTPRGWVTGEAPVDRVETWVRSMSQQSGWSKEYISWTCKWADHSISRADRDVLRRKYQVFMGVAGRLGDRITTIGEPLD